MLCARHMVNTLFCGTLWHSALASVIFFSSDVPCLIKGEMKGSFKLDLLIGCQVMRSNMFDGVDGIQSCKEQ